MSRPAGVLPIAAFAALGVLAAVAPRPVAAQGSADPAVERGVVDTLHGVAVADPYRWMEDLADPRVRTWASDQDARARAFAAGFDGYETIRAGIERIAAVRRFRAPTAAGGSLFYLRFPATGGPPGSSPGTVLLTRPAAGDGPERVVVDPAAEGLGAEASLARGTPSVDGRRVAYGITRAGSRWETVRIRDVESGRDLDEALVGIRSGGSAITWALDGTGFWYERFPVPAEGEEQSARVGDEGLWYHRLGTPQSEDVLVFEDPEHPDRGLWHAVTDDGRLLLVGILDPETQHSAVFARDLADPSAGFTPLVAGSDAAWAVAGGRGPVAWLYTDLDAPRGRVVAIDVRRPERAAWREVVPEADETISSWLLARAVGDRIVVGYVKDARVVIRTFTPEGRQVGEMEVPAGSSIWTGFVGRQGDPITYYVQSGLVDPGSIYRLDVRTGGTELVLRADLGWDPEDFVTEQVFLESRDGTRIPMFVVRGRETPRPAPVWIYGYGFGAWPAAPWFQPAMVEWLRMGGVWALPNTRGGGEYGEAWHAAGSRTLKQNAIDDYLAATEWLIEEGFTTPSLAVANASSAGGAIAGAAIVQRPDLYGAAVLDFPVLDLLRYHRFTVAGSWRSEYGTVEDPEDFRALLGYSPVHNVEPGTCYPATLVAPGEKDQITPPFHAYKFVAALEEAQACEAPVLLRVSWGAGHAPGADLDASIGTWADQLAFLARVLDLRVGRGADRR